jgi:hypothetical protein
MLGRLLGLLAVVTVLAMITASAAALFVNGGTLQAFRIPVDIEISAPHPPELTCTFDESIGLLEWTASRWTESYQVYHSPPGEDDYSPYGSPIEAPGSSALVGPDEVGHVFAVTALGPGGESALSGPVHCPPEDDGNRGATSNSCSACSGSASDPA